MRNIKRLTIVAVVLAIVLPAALAAQEPQGMMQFFGSLPQRKIVQSDEQYLADLNKDLDKAMADLKAGPQPPHRPLAFGVQVNFAHSAYAPHIPVDVLLKWVDMAKEGGAARIEFNPGIGPWLKNDQETMEKYDAMVSHARELGLKITINPTTYTNDLKVASLAEYQKAAVPIYAEMARRYKPDTFVVVHEPTTLSVWMHVQTTPDEWKDFVTAAAKAIKAVSPQTRIGAGVFQIEEPYFNMFVAHPDVDILTIDLYFFDALAQFEPMIANAHKAGKDVYIEETWRYAVRCAAAPCGEADLKNDALSEIYEGVDKRWLDMTALYAENHGLSGVTPFWTSAYFTYVPDGSNMTASTMAVAQAAMAGKRSGTFEEFKTLTARYAH